MGPVILSCLPPGAEGWRKPTTKAGIEK